MLVRLVRFGNIPVKFSKIIENLGVLIDYQINLKGFYVYRKEGKCQPNQNSSFPHVISESTGLNFVQGLVVSLI